MVTTSRMGDGTSTASSSFLQKPSKALVCKRVPEGIASRQEAAFMEVWREHRAVAMQPRSEALPSAQSRMEALRARIVGRGNPT